MTPYWSDMVEFFLDSLVLIFPVTIKIELRLGLVLVVKFIKMVFSISATTAILFVWSQCSKIQRSSNINGPWYIHSSRLFFPFFAFGDELQTILALFVFLFVERGVGCNLLSQNCISLARSFRPFPFSIDLVELIIFLEELFIYLLYC